MEIMVVLYRSLYWESRQLSETLACHLLFRENCVIVVKKFMVTV